MKTIVIFALFALCAFAVVRRPMSSTDIATLDRIKAQNNWGSFIIQLAETHVMTNGPVSELLKAIDELTEDLSRKLEQANNDWDRRTARHESEVRRLNDLINKAKQDVADTQQQLNDILLPQRKSLQAEIVATNAALEKNSRDYAEEIAQRQRRQVEFEQKQIGYAEALEALTQCIDLLTPLVNGGTALVEIKKAHRAITSLTNKLKTHNVEMEFMKALAQLASSEFANTDAVQAVISKMNEMRDKFHRAKDQAVIDNDAEIVANKVELGRLSDQRSELTNKLNKKTEQLAQTEEQIEAAKIFIEQRTSDQHSYEQALVEENDRYEADRKQYVDLVAEFNSELKACSEAKYVLENATFEDYIGNRMQQDKVIDTAHGGPALPSAYKVPI